MAFATSSPVLLSLLLAAFWIGLSACGSGSTPAGGEEVTVEITAPGGEAAQLTAAALRTRLELAGWPWFSVEVSGPTELRVRVGELQGTQRGDLKRLLSVPLHLAGFVTPAVTTRPLVPPDAVPTFTSDDVVHAHLEDVRGSTRVQLELSSVASRRLEEASRQNIGGSLVMFLDGEFLMAPALRAPIRGGLVRLTLDGETGAAAHLASMELVVGLRGQLPVPVRINSEGRWHGADDPT